MQIVKRDRRLKRTLEFDLQLLNIILFNFLQPNEFIIALQ